MARSRQRPGLRVVSTEPAVVRQLLEALCDVVGRVTGSSGLPKIKLLGNTVKDDLDPTTATTAQIATRVNEIAVVVNQVVQKANEIITRIQED